MKINGGFVEVVRLSGNIVKEIIGLLSVVGNTFIVYLFLILAISFLGPRQRSQVSIGELLTIALIGSSVETALIAGNTTLIAGLVSLATLLLSNRLFSNLMDRFPQIRKALLGKPIPLVYQGKVLHHELHAAGMTESDVLQGIRLHGYEDIEQVRLAVLEIDGDISVIPKESKKSQDKS